LIFIDIRVSKTTLLGRLAVIEALALVRRIAVVGGIAVIGGLAVIGGIAVVERLAVIGILYRNTDNFDRSPLFKFIIFMFRVA
jgi:hypothetical protein